jgi:hypothetical protein
MTALGGREVKRTFSVQGAKTAGLPSVKTHEGGRQNVGYFADLPAAIRRLFTLRHMVKLNGLCKKSSLKN